jgi:hypothetical protein
MVKSSVGCGYPGSWLREVMWQVQQLVSSKVVGRSHTDKEEESRQYIFPAESIRSLGIMDSYSPLAHLAHRVLCGSPHKARRILTNERARIPGGSGGQTSPVLKGQTGSTAA